VISKRERVPVTLLRYYWSTTGVVRPKGGAITQAGYPLRSSDHYILWFRSAPPTMHL
jgi:hypothetical protein